MNVVLQVLYTVLGLGFLIFIHELGHFVAAKIFKVQTNEFSLGMGPKLISVKKIKATGKKKVTSFFSKEKPELDPDGNTAYSIRLLSIGGFVSMEGENEDSECDNALNRKPKWQRLIIMLAGITMNIIVAILITFVLTLTTSTPTTTIAVFENDSVSYETGLRENDKIVKIGNTKISTYTDISRAFQDNIGKTSVDVTVERDGVTVELKDVKFPRITSKGDPATEEDAARGELILFSVDFKVYAQKKTVGNVIKTTFADTFSQVKVMYETLYDLVTNKISVKYISGPVGASTVIKQAADAGIASFMYILGFISINLAVINLLPLPALDGGQAFLLLIEMITRKQIPEKVKGAINAVGMVLIFGLAIVIAIKDVIFL